MGLLFCRYTLFAQSELSGEAIMKPLWFDFPSEVETFDIQDEHLVGKCSCYSVTTRRCDDTKFEFSSRLFQARPCSCIQSWKQVFLE